MTKTTNRPATKRSSRAAPVVPAPAAPVIEEREPRGARRKRETRARLLDAALRLMAEKGMEGVAINEITEAADVGFGSFYNHFESKEAIYATLVDNVFEEFANMLDRLAAGITDPAEVVSVSVRHTVLRARHDPVWGRFLIREGFSARAMSRGLGQRLLRDIGNGIAAKRFVVADPFIGFLAVGGTVLCAIAAELNFVAPGASAASVLKELGFSGEHFPERTAAMLLQTLGLKRAEAEKIAARPLPVVEEAVEEN
ncbi:TetR/AcrR family transcriptional regulator [Paraburkholderia caribensis]|jgi:AcrR family transcriptional regulator|uniref:TetR family transcriptional regulator n=1 Tax=Paraburkholderia caribensis TaxID=75105 RepID=A0A9Q6S6W4_9BURK|nr:TetR/AcrR family transcriptional regulator [Paraburkholderia caribensis]MCO4876957.1 TetR/AcrR family transcriptional regulator [Paraburkholderia caribensis]PTB30700.1 TetR family transcriptional regulator [Paraburkholderia caribensis]QLB65601.1 TetR family transcriptional regulator [Paraburkholderia caribensis]